MNVKRRCGGRERPPHIGRRADAAPHHDPQWLSRRLEAAFGFGKEPLPHEHVAHARRHAHGEEGVDLLAPPGLPPEIQARGPHLLQPRAHGDGDLPLSRRHLQPGRHLLPRRRRRARLPRPLPRRDVRPHVVRLQCPRLSGRLGEAGGHGKPQPAPAPAPGGGAGRTLREGLLHHAVGPHLPASQHLQAEAAVALPRHRGPRHEPLPRPRPAEDRLGPPPRRRPPHRQALPVQNRPHRAGDHEKEPRPGALAQTHRHPVAQHPLLRRRPRQRPHQPPPAVRLRREQRHVEPLARRQGVGPHRAVRPPRHRVAHGQRQGPQEEGLPRIAVHLHRIRRHPQPRPSRRSSRHGPHQHPDRQPDPFQHNRSPSLTGRIPAADAPSPSPWRGRPRPRSVAGNHPHCFLPVRGAVSGRPAWSRVSPRWREATEGLPSTVIARTPREGHPAKQSRPCMTGSQACGLSTTGLPRPSGPRSDSRGRVVRPNPAPTCRPPHRRSLNAPSPARWPGSASPRTGARR